MYTDPEPPLCASLEKGRNGEFFVLRVTTHLNSSRHRRRWSWGKESQAVNACKQLARPRINSRGRELAHDEREGTRVPDTDESWGPGEVPQLGQTAMRFGR